MRKNLIIPTALYERVTKYLQSKGAKFTELVKRALDEFLKKEGF